MAGSSTDSGLPVIRPAGGTAPGAASHTAGEACAFFFDLAVPEAYLTAERILSLMPGPCEWVPVLATDLPGGGWGAWRCAEEREIELSQLERLAASRGLQPVRWPAELPFDSGLAMRAATFAKGAGKTVAFSLAAFRQAYAGGRDLSGEDGVVLAGAACEIHPRALLQGAGMRAVADRLARATALAGERGVRTVPAVRVDGEVFHGDAALEDAAAVAARL